jgi:rod shape determining protein RodA
MEIKNPKHIIVSGIYMLLPFLMIFLQPDFGSAAILFMVWFGLVLVAGISKKHLALILGVIILAAGAMWLFVLQPYQKARIMTFVDPLSDIQGTGYNAYQSTIAVGSGQILGKGVGFGTQSRLKFLPEYQTDFIFAAFSEEWGYIGAALLLLLLAIVVWRIIKIGMEGATNFETLFALGFAIMIMTHVIINVGMNIGLMPVTGITLPFLSYGGSHMITLFMGLGILMSMRSYGRQTRRDVIQTEALDSIHL